MRRWNCSGQECAKLTTILCQLNMMRCRHHNKMNIMELFKPHAYSGKASPPLSSILWWYCNMGGCYFHMDHFIWLVGHSHLVIFYMTVWILSSHCMSSKHTSHFPLPAFIVRSPLPCHGSASTPWVSPRARQVYSAARKSYKLWWVAWQPVVVV